VFGRKRRDIQALREMERFGKYPSKPRSLSRSINRAASKVILWFFKEHNRETVSVRQNEIEKNVTQ